MYKNIFLLFIILLLGQAGCRQNDTPSPLKFKAYEHNPVLVQGEPGSWDDLNTGIPNIVWDDSTFYLFYTGYNVPGKMAIGLATSRDGIHYQKFADNPVIFPDSTGFDAFAVGSGIVVEEDTVWVMYFNGLETAGYYPGPSIGKATASILTGPWTKNDTPVLTSGTKGEWDAGFIIPCSVLPLDKGGYIMYYLGGCDIVSEKDFFIGMATSKDGITWKKYNDPATTQHPFAESDPVLKSGSTGRWDSECVWMANVTQFPEGFRMYYSGSALNTGNKMLAIGYATSIDGIHWERYPGNPFFQVGDDPFARSLGTKGSMENPSLLFLDTTCFMYYDYDTQGKIGLATARVH